MFYYPADVVIEVQTNLNTGLYIHPLRHQTILEIKGIVEGLHVKLFPEHGEIHVIKVKAILPEGKVTLENGDVIGNVYTEWEGKIIIRAGKRKSDASHAIGPNPSLLPTNSHKETAREYDPSNATGSDPSMSNAEALVVPAGEHGTCHGTDPDPNISDQELQLLREPPKRSKPSTETANCSKAGQILSLLNSSEKTEDGNPASHATGPNFYDGHIYQKSPVKGFPTEMKKLSNAGESSLLPNSLQISFPTSVSLAANWMLSCKSSGDASISPTTCKTCGSLVRYLKQSTRPSVEAKKFPKSCEASLLPSNLQESIPKSPSLTPKLKRSPSTRIRVIGPGTSSVRADTTKAFWDFWETFKQRRLKMVAYVPNRPLKSPKGAKRRVTGPKTQKRLGVTGRT